ncbi:MAG: hypothetical protein AWU54_1803 [Candidatus Frackibacter sp. T328-2]|nr:MAG: hypothetical protein AWU54_1803 [Candidatus Frackibacter sp. T328-2]
MKLDINKDKLKDEVNLVVDHLENSPLNKFECKKIRRKIHEIIAICIEARNKR